jgi:DNA-binding HxlR family transcriptional regulator
MYGNDLSRTSATNNERAGFPDRPNYGTTSERPLLIQAKVDLCPIKESAKILGKKWYLVIIHRLLGKRMGFNELKEAVGDISAKILSQALQDMAEKGIVERRVSSESPIRVEYSLTQQGQDLRRVLEELYDWGKKWAICKDPVTQQMQRYQSTTSPASGDVEPSSFQSRPSF